jgi:hypothetical protein
VKVWQEKRRGGEGKERERARERIRRRSPQNEVNVEHRKSKKKEWIRAESEHIRKK